MEEEIEKDAKTILIVDDEQPIVDILVYNLKKEGYNTIEASDGITAVEVALEKKPDLILLDIMLPKLDGLSVCKRIKNSLNVLDTSSNIFAIFYSLLFIFRFLYRISINLFLLDSCYHCYLFCPC